MALGDYVGSMSDAEVWSNVCAADSRTYSRYGIRPAARPHMAGRPVEGLGQVY